MSDSKTTPDKMKVAELRAALEERDLDTKGTKPVLVGRLQAALDAEKPPVKEPAQVETQEEPSEEVKTDETMETEESEDKSEVEAEADKTESPKKEEAKEEVKKEEIKEPAQVETQEEPSQTNKFSAKGVSPKWVKSNSQLHFVCHHGRRMQAAYDWSNKRTLAAWPSLVALGVSLFGKEKEEEEACF